MIPFRFKLLESFNFSILGPHVKFQPTSNESLIKQNRNGMCDRYKFPLGQDVGLETRRLDTAELKVLKKRLCPMPKEKWCILHLPKIKRNRSSSETQRYLDQVTRFWAFLFPSYLSLLLIFVSSFTVRKKKWRIQWYFKNMSNLRRQKDKAVSASRIILASQKLLLPLKPVSWSSKDSWDSASS